MLIALAGLPGSGKSTLARRLGRALGMPVLSVDPIEAALFRAGIERSDRTGLAAYLVVEALAARQLEMGLSPIVDASNYVEPARAMWRDLALRHGVALRWIETVVSDEAEHRRRLASRGVDIPGFYSVGWADVIRRREETDPWHDERLVVDMSQGAEAALERVQSYLGR